MTLSSYAVNHILSQYFPVSATHYLALHVSDPTTAGLASTEVSHTATPVYVRKAMGWSEPANRSVYNTSPVQWTGLPSMSIDFLGVWDAASNGHLLASLAFAQTLIVLPGQPIYLPPGGVAVTLGGSPAQRASSIITLDPDNPVVFTPAAPNTIDVAAASGNTSYLVA